MRYVKKSDIYTVFGYSGQVMIYIGIMCLIPLIVNLIYFETNFLGYIVAGAFSIAVGFLFKKCFNSYTNSMKLKHAMMISSFSWIWAGLASGIAISMITGVSYIDGIFENISALTGTGITIFSNVETLPHSILFFRSLEQWVGGLGVVVMVLGITNRAGSATSKLYQSEAREERIKPSIKNTLKKTFKIYAIFTLAGIILYMIVGLPIFDSICLSFTSISTGGMSIKNANVGYYHNNYVYIITMILMILGATSFLVHYKIFKTKGKALIRDIQFKILIAVIIITCTVIILTTKLIPVEVIFTVISAITTTGASVNSSFVLSTWPSFVLIILITLMLIGGPSGSTVGAIKILRVTTFFKGVYRHVKEILSPEGRVIPTKINKHIIPDKVIAESGSYISLYLVFILISWIIFCMFSYNPFKSLFGLVSLQGNVGLELGIVNGQLPDILKVISIFNMWIGRLEIYPSLILIRGILEMFKR